MQAEPMNEVIDYTESFKELAAKDYLVKDWNTEEAKFIFLLESPHVDEVEYQVPVAGSSGRMMSKILFQGETTPLGRLAKAQNHSLQNHLSRIGLMNVCNIPMQAIAYEIEDRENHSCLIMALEAIRVRLSETYRIPAQNTVRDLVKADFSKRLDQLRGKSRTIITCGRLATYYFKQFEADPSWTVIDGIPHPSRNQWYQDLPGIEQLKLLFPAQPV